jgi:uncharacterized protein YqgQ
MKTKHILFTSLFLLLVLFSKAQDKYEFMTIGYDYIYKEIIISINGKEFLKEKLELPKEERSHLNTNPLLAKTIEYQDKGWELMNFETYVRTAGSLGVPDYIAYLKKKK